MLEKGTATGDKIEITLRKDIMRTNVQLSQIMDVVDRTHIICAQPFSAGYLVKLPLGSFYSFLIFSGGGMTQYEASIKRLFKEDNLYLMEVEIETAGKRQQRRSHFRLHGNLPLKFSVIKQSEELVSAGAKLDEMLDGVTNDLSGSGLRFVTNEKVQERSKLRCILFIDSEYFIAIAKVIYVTDLKRAAYRYQCRINFISVLPEEQERLIQYITKKQLEHASRNANYHNHEVTSRV